MNSGKHLWPTDQRSLRLLPIFFLLAVVRIGSWKEENQVQASHLPATLQLDALDDGKQLKLLVRHRELGLICELWCYEGGPFGYGRVSKREDGSVVFIHTHGKKTATTTFIPVGEDRVWMDIVVVGPLEELKQVTYMGPCMQFWHSDGFRRKSSLVDFAQRCFIYTVRGPLGLMETARGPMKGFSSDSPENNPPFTQWYVPIERVHPGDIWAFGASGDRPLYGLVGVTSQDQRWLAAIGCARTRTLGQGWHDCIHHVPEMQGYLDKNKSQLRHRTVIYVMPNDKRRLLDTFRKDVLSQIQPHGIRASVGAKGALEVGESLHNNARLRLALTTSDRSVDAATEPASPWEESSWGGFVRRNRTWQMWAVPNSNKVDLWVSGLPPAETKRIEADFQGAGWKPISGVPDVPALVQTSSDKKRLAAFFWEESESGRPASPAFTTDKATGVASARGRLYLFNGSLNQLPELWKGAKEDWLHSRPYRMPPDAVGQSVGWQQVRFSPNAEDEMTYGLTILPPWKDGGTLHVNFPEHFEHDAAGHGILRYSDKRKNPWIIAADGRSASYDVESLELPGVRVSASAEGLGDRARLRLRIVNRGDSPLENIKPLLCFWYSKLTGFPAQLSNNFDYTYVPLDGRLRSLSSIETLNPLARAKVAYVRGCYQHDCDKFARSRGGLIEKDVDRALIAVSNQGGTRKLVIRFTPGKSLLSNAVIPCVHADPYFPRLAPGESAEASGEVLFTEASLEAIGGRLK